MDMKGYRTIVVFAVVTIAGILGHHLPDAVVQAYASDIIQITGMLGIGLRLITNSPFGQKEIAKIEASGVSADDVNVLLAKLPQQADISDLLSAVGEVKNMIATLPTTTSQTVAAIPNATAAQAPGV